MSKKVLLIVASKGFQPLEYQEPKGILRDAGFTVVTASDRQGVAVASDGFETEVDVTIDNVQVEDYAGVFIIGGPGALENLDNERTYAVVRKARQLTIPYGAICISTRILARAGVLEDINATGWNGDGKIRLILEENGATYLAEELVVDGTVVTATGPSVAQDFGRAIIDVLNPL